MAFVEAIVLLVGLDCGGCVIRLGWLIDVEVRPCSVDWMFERCDGRKKRTWAVAASLYACAINRFDALGFRLTGSIG